MIRKIARVWKPENKEHAGPGELSSKIEDAHKSPVGLLPPKKPLPELVVPAGGSFSVQDLETPHKPSWCAGCGDYGVLIALRNALQRLNVPLEKFCLVYGVGCHGLMRNHIRTYGFAASQGLALPVAMGVKIANDALKVLVIVGDGDLYGNALQHLLLGLRENHDVTVIVLNNMVRGLSGGQSSPTALGRPLRPLALALSSGASFVARGFSGEPELLSDTIIEAVMHPGFSLVDVVQPCVVFDPDHSSRWFENRVELLNTPESSRSRAIDKLLSEEKVSLGVLYKDTTPSFSASVPKLQEEPLLHRPTEGIDMSRFLFRFG